MAFVFLSACSVLMMPSEADMSWASNKFPGITLDQLKQGETIFEQHCNLCHPYKKPNSRTEDQWKQIVPVMVARVNKKEGKEEIDPAAQQLLLEYLITMSTSKK